MEHAGTVCTGLCPVQSSADIIVIGNVATVTSQLLLHRARRCIGHKRPMDQMCYKCKTCFSHDIQKISKFRNFQKFPKVFFLSEFVFFIELFLTKMFFLTIFFQRIFIAFKTITLY